MALGAKIKLRLRKGDRVVVLSGKDVGKEGEITRVLPERGRAIVDGVNVAKKHQKPTSATTQGGIIDKDMPIQISNLALLCPSCNKATRVGYRLDPDGTKHRACKKCGKDI
jgi:large subunit ribosomal protein L24